MKRIFFLLLLCMIQPASYSQITTPQKVYYLCKVWGYLKYHHPNNCNIGWNKLFIEKADSIVNSTTDQEFNGILYNMCLQTGITSPPATPAINIADSAKNYHTDWFNDAPLAPNVRNFLDSVQAHRVAQVNNCMVKLNDYGDSDFISYLDFRNDSITNIPNYSNANAAHRLLVYAYYWNAINYFFSQIDIADHPWDSTLVHFVPDILNANNDSTFHLAMARVVSRIDDSHGSFVSLPYIKHLTGVNLQTEAIYYSRLKIERIENKNVVVASGETNINRGDIITRIDGMDADSFFMQWAPLMAVSNQAVLYRNCYSWLIQAPYNNGHTLELTDASNTTQQITLPASTTAASYTTWRSANDTLPEWMITDCGYGYVNMGKLTQGSVYSMYYDLEHTPGIVFDLRNYPRASLWPLKPLLFPEPNITAHILYPNLSYPGYYTIGNDLNNFGNWYNSSPYQGKIIILVNEATQSQAEYTAQALRTHPNATIMGSQTAGADGDIVYLTLPSGLTTYWSGLGWYQADWTNPQRAGVRVDSIVRPTISSIRNGEDLLLKKALTCPLTVTETITKHTAFSVGQQARQLYINSTDQNQPYVIEVFNMLGQRMLHQDNNQNRSEVSLSHCAAGTYIVSITGGKHPPVQTKILLR